MENDPKPETRNFSTLNFQLKKMRRIKVKAGQSLMDIAVQEYGAVSQVFELVRANGLRGITDNVWAGDELVIPGSGPNRQRAAFMQAHQPIATIQDTDRAAGIGFWWIHFELKVS